MRSLIPWRKNSKSSVSESMHPVMAFEKEMDHLFDRFLSGRPFAMNNWFKEEDWFPKVDVNESKKNITVKAELPGVDKKDIKVTLNKRKLTIKGEKKQELDEENGNYHRIERSYGTFLRTIDLPTDVDENKVEAKYKKGVLTIDLLKTRQGQSKSIEVKAN